MSVYLVTLTSINLLLYSILAHLVKHNDHHTLISPGVMSVKNSVCRHRDHRMPGLPFSARGNMALE